MCDIAQNLSIKKKMTDLRRDDPEGSFSTTSSSEYFGFRPFVVAWTIPTSAPGGSW